MVSGSRLADSDVNPTRSAKRTVTTRRSVALPAPSAVSPAGPAAAVVGVAIAAPRLVPQLPQNLAPAAFVAPQFGQPPRAVPHPMQKRPSDGLSVPQVWQITMVGE